MNTEESNAEDKIFPVEYDIEQIRTEIETWKVDDNPRIVCGHSAIIKSSTRAYQVATCLEIVNEHTGELHHYAIEIHNVHKYKSKGWVYQEKYRINDLVVFELLHEFLTLIKDNRLGKEYKKRHLIEDKDFQLLEGVKNSDSETIKMIIQNPDTYNNAGGEILKYLLELSLKEGNVIDLVQRLGELDLDSLKKLNSLAGISQLKGVLEIWNQNKDNDDEEFWQTTLSEYSWIISQLFSFPVVLFERKAYVGGKWVDNRGGNITDFIYQNKLTQNVILIEIKTPETNLIGGKYRQTYSVTPDLSGSANQILNYKQKLGREYGNIVANNPDKPRFDNFSPKCLVIIGNFEKEIGNDYRRKEAFELFRSNSRETDIITFDELFHKVEMLLNLLEGK